MTSKSKFPIPYILFLSLLIFIISIFFVVFAVEHIADKNSAEVEEITTVVENTTDVTRQDIETTKITTTNQKTTTATTKPTTTKPITTKPITTQVTTTQQPTTKPSTTKSATTQGVSGRYFSKSDVELVAKILYEECRGVSSDTQKACVAWIICNRVDSGMGNSISSVVKAKNQFDYNPYAPIKQNLYNLAQDVLTRWEREKNGETNVGRVLPKEYLYFYGDGIRNYFRNSYQKPYTIWDYSLPSPYST